MTRHPAALLAALGALGLSGIAPLAPAATTDKTTPHQPVKKTVAGKTTARKLSGEIRAMWVVRDSMTSPQKIRNTVALARKHGFNTLFVQVRGRGDAFYDSRFEPRSEELADAPLDFDPLAVAVEEGHRAGLEVHAWMNTFLVWHKNRRPWSSSHVVNRHPEWLVQDKQGNRRITPGHDCEGGFLDPALPEVREHTANVFLDVVSRYPVDGVHFDYVRYPHGGYSFSARALSLFRQEMLTRVSPEQAAYADVRLAKNRLAWYYCFPNEWKSWRQEQITETVRQISQAAHTLKPGIIVSAAVFPSYGVASEDKGQAWRHWLSQGILDAACPMTYNRSTKMVAAQVRDAVIHSSGKPIVPGVGAWQMPAASAIAKGKAFRELGASGMNFFSYDGMTREGRTEAYLRKVGGALFTTPAPIPDWRRPVETASPEPAFGG